MKYKVLRGFDVRTGPDEEDGSIPTRRVAEAGDVISLADVPEWDEADLQSEIAARVIEPMPEEEPQQTPERITAPLPELQENPEG